MKITKGKRNRTKNKKVREAETDLRASNRANTVQNEPVQKQNMVPNGFVTSNHMKIIPTETARKSNQTNLAPSEKESALSLKTAQRDKQTATEANAAAGKHAIDSTYSKKY